MEPGTDCRETETYSCTELAQRLKIAKLIIEGKTYEEFSPEVGTSTSTVSKIGQIIKFGKGSFSKIFANQSKL